MKILTGSLPVIALAFGVASANAQQPNMELMAKWSAIAVIHYDVVAEYAGDVEILRGPRGFAYSAQVTDRVEVAFDWNQNETKLVGKPVIRNCPTMVTAAAPKPECPPVRMSGAYEHADVTDVKGMDYNPALDLVTSRTFPAGAIPYPGEHATGKCGDAWDESAARSEPTSLGILVVPAMYLAMPTAVGPGITVRNDGKTITAVQSGWTYTYTLTAK